jgi:hypothetical protein
MMTLIIRCTAYGCFTAYERDTSREIRDYLYKVVVSLLFGQHSIKHAAVIAILIYICNNLLCVGAGVPFRTRQYELLDD